MSAFMRAAFDTPFLSIVSVRIPACYQCHSNDSLSATSVCVIASDLLDDTADSSGCST